MCQRSSTEEQTWIAKYCSQKGNEFFCEVSRSYIKDVFNLQGLDGQVPFYEQALKILLNNLTKDDTPLYDIIEEDAKTLYGLIHARYIRSDEGMWKMLSKYRNKEFGLCPRAFCEDQPVLPIGLSNTRYQHQVKVYCPQCKEVYEPKLRRHRRIDGAFFGTDFALDFFLTYLT